MSLDIKDLPLIGEYVFVRNYNTGKIEKLRAARHVQSNMFDNITIVQFCSSNPEENTHEENGLKFRCQRSYYPNGKFNMKDEYLFKSITTTAEKKTYCRAIKINKNAILETKLSPFRNITFLEKGSDCGTKRTTRVSIRGEYSGFLYRYILVGDEFIELTPDNISQYVNKTVDMRAAFLCESNNGICNICSGNSIYHIVKNQYVGGTRDNVNS